MRDVTRRLGVSPNAAYRHFADRDALLAAIAARIHAGMAERMRDAAPTAAAPQDLLRAVGLGYIGFALAEPGWFDVAFARIDTVPDAAAAALLPPPLMMLVSALDALVETGEARRVRAAGRGVAVLVGSARLRRPGVARPAALPPRGRGPRRGGPHRGRRDPRAHRLTRGTRRPRPRRVVTFGAFTPHTVTTPQGELSRSAARTRRTRQLA